MTCNVETGFAAYSRQRIILTVNKAIAVLMTRIDATAEQYAAPHIAEFKRLSNYTGFKRWWFVTSEANIGVYSNDVAIAVQSGIDLATYTAKITEAHKNDIIKCNDDLKCLIGIQKLAETCDGPTIHLTPSAIMTIMEYTHLSATLAILEHQMEDAKE